MIELTPALIETGKWLFGFLAGSATATGMAADASKLAGQLVMTVLGDEVSDRVRGVFGGPGRGDPASRELNHHIEQAYRLAELSALVQFVQRYARHTGTGDDAYAALATAQGVERLASSYRAVEADAQVAYSEDIGLPDIAATLISVNENDWQGLAPAVQALRQRLEERALKEMAHVVDLPAPAAFAQAFRHGDGPELPPWYALLAHNFAAVLLDGRHDQAKDSMLLRMVSRAALRVTPQAGTDADATQALEQRLRDELKTHGAGLASDLAAAVGRVGDSLGSDLQAVRAELAALAQRSATIAGLMQSVDRSLQHVRQLLEDYGQDLRALRDDVRKVEQMLAAERPARAATQASSKPAVPPWQGAALGTLPAAGAAPIGRQKELQAVAAFAEAAGPEAPGMLAVLGRGGSGKTLLVTHALRLQTARAPTAAWPPAVLFLRAVDGDRQLVASAIAACDRLLAALGQAPVAGNAQFATIADKLAYVDESLAGHGVQALLVLDSLEAALDPADARPLDDELGQLLAHALRHQASALRLLFTSQVAPVVDVDGLWRPVSAAVSGSVRVIDLGGGLHSATDGVALLRRHDPDGTLGLGGAPDALLEALSRCVGGNPNALKHVAMLLDLDRSLDPSTLLQRLQDEQAVHPEVERVREHLIGRYFERLPAPQQRFLQALAVQGGQAPLAAVAALLDTVDGDARSLAGELGRRQFLRREGSEHAIHDSERAYYLARLEGSAALPALQRRAADHWAGVAVPAARWASHADAQATLREIALRSRAGDAARAAPARREAAQRLYDLGLLSAATQLLLDASAAEQLQPGELERLGQLALCHWKAGAFLQGRQVCADALAQWSAVAGQPDAVIAGLRQTQAACVLETGAVHEAIEAYQLLVDELSHAGDPALDRVKAQAAMDLAFARSMAGQAQRAIDEGRRAVALCTPPKAAAPLPALQAMATGYLATYLTYVPAFDDARGLYQDAVLQATRCEARYERAIVYGLAAELELLEGRAERTIALCRAALDAQNDTDAITGSWCHYLIAQALAGMDDGLAPAREAAEIACRFSRPLNDANPRTLLGMLLLREGSGAQGIAELEQAVRTTDVLVAACPQNWEAWIAQGWALLGLAAQGRASVEAAMKGYRSAHAASPHPGHFARIRVQLAVSAAVLKAGPPVLPQIAALYGIAEGASP